MKLSLSPFHQRQSPPPKSTTPAKHVPEPELAPDAYCREHAGKMAIGSTVLAGLSLLGMACTSSPGPAVADEIVSEAGDLKNVCLERSSVVARVIVVDDFANADTGTTHGETVEVELSRFHHPGGEHPDITMERAQVNLWDGEHGIIEGKPGALESYLRSHFAGRMTRDAQALEGILQGGGPRGVIHQSQGASESRAIDAVYYRALHEKDFGSALQRQLGMSPTALSSDAERRDFLQGLVNRADQIYSGDPEVAQARTRLREVQDRLDQQGFIHVISAGNQGYLYRDMVRLGVDIPKDFFTNDFAGPRSIIVGAADNQSKDLVSHGYDVASLASPFAGAQIGADGVDRPMTVDGKSGLHSGSSYAAPQVSSTILDMLRINPEVSRDQALEQLLQSARHVDGGDSYLGAGVLQPPDMLLCDGSLK